MNLKKFLTSWLILCCLFSSLSFAYEGKMEGETNLKSVKTKYFDIVYPESCSESAAILYEKADKIYEDMAERYNWPA